MQLDYLQQLNEVQGQAVTHKEGPLMIIAGAGSGKTRVLTYRMAHLLKSGADPFEIISLTFTNKAAREMRERIEGLVGTEARNLWMGTFHSLFARILRREAQHIGYPNNFTIYDSDDSKSLIKTLLKEENLDAKLYKPGMVLGRISLAKNNFITPRQYLEDPDVKAEDLSAGRPKMGELYMRYQQRLFKAGSMDFDDILVNTYKLFKEHTDVLNKYQQRFKYVLVDEYQDTNYIQYLIIRKLAAVHRNICVVGDDAQSIYAFRGANIQNILNFEKDYPDLKVYKLEQNYRSTVNIVKAADSVIAKNKAQLKKALWTQNQEGSKILVRKTQTDSEEGRLVAQSIFEERMNSKYKNSDFAILYRTNAQSRSMEEWLRKNNIPYQIIGGISFYQRKEVKDLLAYFRLVINPHDEEAVKRIINFPKRGIGKTTLDKITLYARDNEISLWEVLEHIASFDFDARVVKTVGKFVLQIRRFQAEHDSSDAYKLGALIGKETGILKELHEDKTPEGQARYENIEELLSGIQEFVQRLEEQRDAAGEEHQPVLLSEFMQEVALLTDQDLKDEDTDKVTLMTIHSAKGLEFPVVYIVGLEENLFPSQMSLDSRDDLEEERRLFYVALTRAREKAFLSYAKSRFRWGQVVPCEPSRFIEEIDPRYVEFVQAPAGFDSGNEPWQEEGTPLRRVIRQKPKPQPVNHKPSADFTPEDVSDLKVGTEVEHNRFGRGKVVNVEGPAAARKATIEFQGLGQKQILLKFAKMRVVT